MATNTRDYDMKRTPYTACFDVSTPIDLHHALYEASRIKVNGYHVCNVVMREDVSLRSIDFYRLVNVLLGMMLPSHVTAFSPDVDIIRLVEKVIRLPLDVIRNLDCVKNSGVYRSYYSYLCNYRIHLLTPYTRNTYIYKFYIQNREIVFNIFTMSFEQRKILQILLLLAGIEPNPGPDGDYDETLLANAVCTTVNSLRDEDAYSAYTFTFESVRNVYLNSSVEFRQFMADHPDLSLHWWAPLFSTRFTTTADWYLISQIVPTEETTPFVVGMLLLMAGIEPNPGPKSTRRKFVYYGYSYDKTMFFAFGRKLNLTMADKLIQGKALPNERFSSRDDWFGWLDAFHVSVPDLVQRCRDFGYQVPPEAIPPHSIPKEYKKKQSQKIQEKSRKLKITRPNANKSKNERGEKEAKGPVVVDSGDLCTLKQAGNVTSVSGTDPQNSLSEHPDAGAVSCLVVAPVADEAANSDSVSASAQKEACVDCATSPRSLACALLAAHETMQNRAKQRELTVTHQIFESMNYDAPHHIDPVNGDAEFVNRNFPADMACVQEEAGQVDEIVSVVHRADSGDVVFTFRDIDGSDVRINPCVTTTTTSSSPPRYYVDDKGVHDLTKPGPFNGEQNLVPKDDHKKIDVEETTVIDDIAKESVARLTEESPVGNQDQSRPAAGSVDGEVTASKPVKTDKGATIVIDPHSTETVSQILFGRAVGHQALKNGLTVHDRPIQRMVFNGNFAPNLQSTFNPNDPVITVDQLADGRWACTGLGPWFAIDMPNCAIDVASSSMGTENRNLRMRNIYQGLVQEKSVKEYVKSLDRESKKRWVLTQEMRAFLLAGCVTGCGKVRWANDVREWVDRKYIVEPPTGWQKTLNGVIFFANNLKFQAKCVRSSRAATFVVANETPSEPDPADFGTLITGLCVRLFPQDIPERTEGAKLHLQHRADDFCEYVETRVGDKHYDLMEIINDALKHRPKREAEEIRKGAQMFIDDYDRAIEEYLKQPYKCFIKLECYPKGSSKPPRFIMSLPLFCRGIQIAAMGKILLKIEQATELCNVKHLIASEITRKLKRKFENVSLVAETDFSSFESCIDPEMKSLVENRIFLRLADSTAEKEFVLRCLSREEVCVCGPCFTIPKFHHIRMSGDYWTSIGNLLTNIIVSSYVADMSVEEIIEKGMFEGDDGVYPAPENPDACIVRARKAGVKLKFAIAPWHALSFCGNHFEDVDGELVRHRDPHKSLVNLTILYAPNGNSKSDDLKLQRSKCLSVLDGPWVPEASVFAAVVERVTRRFRVSEAFLLKRGYMKEYCPYGVESCVPDWLVHDEHGNMLSNEEFVARVYARNLRAGGKCDASVIAEMLNAAWAINAGEDHIVLPCPFPADGDNMFWDARDGLKYTHVERGSLGILEYAAFNDRYEGKFYVKPSDYVVERHPNTTLYAESVNNTARVFNILSWVFSLIGVIHFIFSFVYNWYHADTTSSFVPVEKTLPIMISVVGLCFKVFAFYSFKVDYNSARYRELEGYATTSTENWLSGWRRKLRRWLNFELVDYARDHARMGTKLD